MIVGGSDRAIEAADVDAHDVEAVVAALVLESDGLFPLLERKIAACADNLVGGIAEFANGLRRLFGRLPGKALHRPGVVHKSTHVVAFAGGVDAGGSFESGKDFVARQDGTAGVAHDAGCTAGLLHIDTIGHGEDGVHLHIFLGGEDKLGAQIVAAIAQHGTPGEGEVAVGEVGFESTSGKALCSLHGSGVGSVGQLAHFAHEFHFGGFDRLTAIVQTHSKEFGAGFEVQFGTAAEGQTAALAEEGGAKEVVAEDVAPILAGEHGHAGLLRLWENHTLRS